MGKGKKGCAKGSGKGPAIDEKGTLLIPAPRTVSNREHFQRLNYIFQVSHYVATQVDDGEHALSRNYMKNMDLIQKKTKVGVSPHVKRGMCKRCHRVQIPQHTMEMAIENGSKKGRHPGSKNDVLVYSCRCGTQKRFPIGKQPDYQLHVEKPGNVIDIDLP